MEQQQQLDRMKGMDEATTNLINSPVLRGVPSVSPNPHPISDQNIHFPHPDLAPKIHTRFHTFVVS